MTMDEIKALIDAMASSDLAEMELSKDGWTLRLSRGPSQAPVLRSSADVAPRPDRARRTPAPPPELSSASEVRAPLFGTVHLGPAPGAPPFCEAGQQVQAGALLCTVEAMKTFNEVRAERAGTIEAVLVATGQEVEAGHLLLRLA